MGDGQAASNPWEASACVEIIYTPARRLKRERSPHSQADEFKHFLQMTRSVARYLQRIEPVYFSRKSKPTAQSTGTIQSPNPIQKLRQK